MTKEEFVVIAKQCTEEVNAVLKKHGCYLSPSIRFRPGREPEYTVEVCAENKEKVD